MALQNDGMCIEMRPFVEKHKLLELAQKLYGLEVEDSSLVRELESYEDRNFFIEGRITRQEIDRPRNGVSSHCQPSSQKYVLKVLHPKNTYSLGFLDAAVKICEYLKEEGSSGGIRFPENIHGLNGDVLYLKDFEIPLDYLAAKDGMLYEKVTRSETRGDHVWKLDTDEKGSVRVKVKLYIRLLSFLPGKTLVSYKLTNDLLFQAGVLVGTVSKQLENFSHPSLIAKKDVWDLKNLLWLNDAKYLDVVSDEKKKSLLKIVFEMFESNILAVSDRLPQQVIHSDLNEGNIIVEEKNGTPEISGLIDFGDITYSYRVFEVSICMAYLALLRPDDCIHAAGTVLAGYLSVTSLSALEYSILYHCVASRIVQSLTIGNYSYFLNPENEYLLNTSKNGFNVLEQFLTYRDNVGDVYEIWQGI